MNKRQTINLGGIICLIVAVYLVYGVLLQDGIAPTSIETVWEHFRHWAKHFHVLAVALLPIYVAFMVFGTSVLGAYLGSALQRRIIQYLQSKRSTPAVIHKPSQL